MYDKNTLAKSTGASLGVVAIVGMLFMSTGMAFAAPVSAVGGFVVSAESIDAEDFVLYPDVDGTTGAEANASQGTSDYDGSNGDYPLAVNELSGVQIEGFQLSKNITLSDYTNRDSLGGTATIVIAAQQNVSIENTLLKSPALQSDGATFRGFEITENNTQDVNEAFQLTASAGSGYVADDTTPQGVAQFDSYDGQYAITLNDADIRASYLVADQVELSNLGLEVWYDADSDGSYEYGGADSAQDSNAGAEPGAGPSN